VRDKKTLAFAVVATFSHVEVEQEERCNGFHCGSEGRLVVLPIITLSDVDFEVLSKSFLLVLSLYRFSI
jgi:hypothetical protein